MENKIIPENVYDGYGNLSRVSISQRVEAFKQSVIAELAKGKSIEDIKSTLEAFKNDEMYEAIKGIMLGIEAFQQNPQTRLF